jgi:hypothetical protein
MAQGTRWRWLRAATAGFGVMFCTGLVGCMNNDKPKDTKIAKQPGQPGLPGTVTLPPGGGAAAKTGQPGAGQFGTNQYGTPGYGQPGGNVQQTGGFGTGQPVGQQRYGTTGANTNNYNSVPPQNFGPAQPGFGGTIGAPSVPGQFNPTPSVQPAGAGLGAAPHQPAGATAFAPPPLDFPVPPVPPYGGAEFAANGVPPPVAAPAPLAPVAPPGVGPNYTKGF